MERSWCRALVAAACLLATASGARVETSVAIESAAPGAAAVSRPAVVLVRDLPVPSGGAVVRITARSQGLQAPATLATAFIVGGRNTGATRLQSFRAVVKAPASVLATLKRDPNATISVVVTPRGRPEAATTAGPFPAAFVHPSERG